MSKQANDVQEKVHCFVHELSQDKDWTNLKRSIVRVPQIIKQKINIGVQLPKDEVYENYYNRFVKVDEDLHLLQSEITKYINNLNQFLTCSISFGTRCNDVFIPTLDNTRSDDDETIGQRQFGEEIDEKSASCLKFTNKMAELSTKIEPDIILINQNISDPLSKVINLTVHIKRSIKERDFAVLDVTRYMNSIESLNEKDKASLTSKQDLNMIKYERNLEVAKLKYEKINTCFNEELPQLFKLVSELIKELFISFYFIQLTIHYHLTGLNEISDPLFKLRTKEVESDIPTFSNIIVESFRKAHKTSADLIKALSITKVRSELIDFNLELNNSQQYNSRSSYSNSIRTEYQMCVANYDYEAMETGDLSFKKGDTIKILDSNFDGDWWKGEIKGEIGIFPRNYITLL